MNTLVNLEQTSLFCNLIKRDNDGRVTEDEFVSATLAHEKVATLLTMKIVNVLVQP